MQTGIHIDAGSSPHDRPLHRYGAYHRPTHVLGETLGVPRVEFPGGHTAYQQHPEEFARCLTQLLNP